MEKIVWTCWLQGEADAPWVVSNCLRSLRRRNPGWDVRCLDATSIETYVSLGEPVDFNATQITPASLSDVLRILLLDRYGGVWADATLFCNRPLDDWLPALTAQAGFFGFAKPAPDRPLASWFLAAEPGHLLTTAWRRRTLDYWRGRNASEDYFWFHHLFAELCETDPDAADAWAKVPEVSADGPHALQVDRLALRPAREAADQVDWSTPVFKLSHRFPETWITPGCLLEHLFRHDDDGAGLVAPL